MSAAPAASPSIPLVLPSNYVYDPANGSVTKDASRPANGIYFVEEALRLLAGLQGPIAVLCIAGPARTGKSYIISRLLGGMGTFAVGHSVAAKTMGIWLARKTLPCDGFQTVVLDCEGSGAVEGSTARDNGIYSLAVMLSSVFVYNSKEAPRADDLDKLSFVANLVRRVCMKEGVRATRSDLRANFPDFVWLLRDVDLPPVLEEGAAPCSWPEYLDRVLTVVDDLDEESERRNVIRRGIKDSFRSFQCFALSRPALSTADLPSLADAQLSPAFVAAYTDFRSRVIASVKPKKAPALAAGAAAAPFTGAMLADFVRMLVPVLNDPKAVPALEPLFVQVIRNVVDRAVEAAMRAYDTTLRAALKPPMNWGALMAAHGAALAAAWADFDGSTAGVDEERRREGSERLAAQVAVFVEAPRGKAKTKAGSKCGTCGAASRTEAYFCLACAQPVAEAAATAVARKAAATQVRSGTEAGVAAGMSAARQALLADATDGEMQALLAEALLRQGRAEEARRAAAEAAALEKRVVGGALLSSVVENERASEQACRALVERKYAPVAERVRSKALATVAAFDVEARAAVAAYLAEARGPRVVGCGADYLVERTGADRRSVEALEAARKAEEAARQAAAKEAQLKAEREEAARKAAAMEAALKQEREAAQKALAAQAEAHKKMLADMAAAEEKRRLELLAAHVKAQEEADRRAKEQEARLAKMQADLAAKAAAKPAAPPAATKPAAAPAPAAATAGPQPCINCSRTNSWNSPHCRGCGGKGTIPPLVQACYVCTNKRDWNSPHCRGCSGKGYIPPNVYPCFVCTNSRDWNSAHCRGCSGKGYIERRDVQPCFVCTNTRDWNSAHCKGCSGKGYIASNVQRCHVCVNTRDWNSAHCKGCSGKGYINAGLQVCAVCSRTRDWNSAHCKGCGGRGYA